MRTPRFSPALSLRASASDARFPLAVVALLALTLTAANPRAALAQESGIAVGATAPGAAVVTLDGRPANLADFIGRTPVVLEFWATWCPLCRRLEPAMRAAQEKYAGRVTFVSVGVSDNQSPERQQRYVTERKLGGTFVFDATGMAVAAYKVPHTSYVVVIDRAGEIVYTGVGDAQNIDAAVAAAFRAKDGR
jgi:thiol-disulfide isomerase/thioredoxin